GGAVINVGSVVSDVAVPLQGFYSASKHAVKGFTDALRMELEEAGTPISVTLIKPAAIDTPYTQNAKNLMKDEPSHVAPVYAPEVVAEAILHAAENPVRDLVAGGGAKLLSAMGKYTPRLTDKFMEKVMIGGTHSGRLTSRPKEGGLYRPNVGGKERGDYAGHVMESSAYTRASLHPMLAGMLGIGATFALATLVRRSRS
ncbi:MAG: SDR family NAD(P)-dependent oxidoreductase, partial [Bryobacteraceae bacterium]|nr:SDR family NAD(P)-dependent oxidoreductase [Bryobacteraceae bacterium]